MRRRYSQFLTIATIISFVTIGILAAGYVAYAHAGVMHVSGSSKGAVEDYHIWLGRGLIEVGHMSGTPASIVGKLPRQGYSPSSGLKFEAPRWQHLLWGFRTNVIHNANWEFRGFQIPIWCALLPCLIAPLLWWRKRAAVPRRGFEAQSNDR